MDIHEGRIIRQLGSQSASQSTSQLQASQSASQPTSQPASLQAGQLASWPTMASKPAGCMPGCLQSSNHPFLESKTSAAQAKPVCNHLHYSPHRKRIRYIHKTLTASQTNSEFQNQIKHEHHKIYL
jgi:hypothetical protein